MGLLDDPDKLTLIAAGLNLLGGAPGYRRNFGADIANAGMQAINTYGQAQQQQRLNKQQELAALMDAWKITQQSEGLARNQAFFSDQPYTPSPQYQAITSKVGGLLGLPATPPRNVTEAGYGALLGSQSPGGGLLSTGPGSDVPNGMAMGGSVVPSPGASGARMVPPIDPYTGASMSSAASNGGAPRLPAPQTSGNGEVIGPGGLAAPQMPMRPPQAPVSGVRPLAPTDAPQLGAPRPQMPQAPSDHPITQMLKTAGIDPRMAALWATTDAGAQALYKKLADVYSPQTTNGIMLQLLPEGGTRFLGGELQKNSLPVTTDAQGNLKMQVVPGASEYLASREGAITGAQEDAKAARDLVQIQLPNGQTRTVTRSQALAMTGGAPQGNANPGNVAAQFPGVGADGRIPPNVQAGRDAQALQMVMQEREQQRAQGLNTDALDREIRARQSRMGGGPAGYAPGGQLTGPANAPGFVSGQSTAQKTAAETNPKLQLEQLSQSYTDNSKANDSLIFVQEARKAVNNATTTGLMAKPALLAARVGAAFGVTDPAAAADPEVFMAMAGRQVMGVIKNLGSGSGISDADREYAAKAIGGDIALNKESINRLLDIQERAVKRGVQLHNNKVEQAAQAGVPSVFDYKITPYSSSPQSGGNVVSLPSGQTYHFPDAASAQKFRNAAGM